MSNLKSALLNTIRGVNASYDAALADLLDVVAEAHEAAKAASAELEVRLVQRERDARGVTYLLVVVKGNDSQRVEYFKISSNGYPIQFSSYKGFEESGSIADKQQLIEHFQKMSENQNSPLVAAITYFLRE